MPTQVIPASITIIMPQNYLKTPFKFIMLLFPSVMLCQHHCNDVGQALNKVYRVIGCKESFTPHSVYLYGLAGC